MWRLERVTADRFTSVEPRLSQHRLAHDWPNAPREFAKGSVEYERGQRYTSRCAEQVVRKYASQRFDARDRLECGCEVFNIARDRVRVVSVVAAMRSFDHAGIYEVGAHIFRIRVG
jgi:hypothetical protein